jgi:hypothetical protein
MVDEIRNKLGRKLFQRTSQRQVQYHKESKLWIPHRKRLYLYWFKFLQIAEQDTQRKVNWKKYDGWGGANYILGVKNFDEFWNDKWKELFGLKTLKDKQRFPISTSKPKIESIRTSYLVHQKLHLKSYVKIAKEIQESELTNRKGIKDFQDATNDFIIESGVYNSTHNTIGKKEKSDKGIGEGRKSKLTASEIKDRFGNVSRDRRSLNSYKNTRVNRILNAESKKIVIGAVNHYRITAESILDGVCEGKYPETPDMRKKETFVRGEGKKKSTKKKSVSDKVEDEIAAIIETYENAEDGAIKIRTQNAIDDLEKMKKYNPSLLSKEERDKLKEEEDVMRLGESILR